MLNGKKVVVVMPAYNAELTLEKTYADLDMTVVDEAILVDDASSDNTSLVGDKLGVKTIRHEQNKGYGGNQKTCYREALKQGADIVVMVHPDYQYDPRLVPAMAGMLASGVYDCAIASRILGKGALEGGMPLYKYIANRFLTFFQNVLCGQKLSEYHTGYRAFTREVLETLPLEENSDDFVFDNEMLAQVIVYNYRIGEISCPTKYFSEASSINFRRSCKYGLGVLSVSVKACLARFGLAKFPIFSKQGKTLLGAS